MGRIESTAKNTDQREHEEITMLIRDAAVKCMKAELQAVILDCGRVSVSYRVPSLLLFAGLLCKSIFNSGQILQRSLRAAEGSPNL